MSSTSLTPSIYLIPTVLAPDTETEVITPQIREIIPQLSTFFVEDVRTARRFISNLQLGITISELSFLELTKNTPPAETLRQLKALKTDAGILSEAGCPGIADPGAVAVGYAHRLGMKVVPLVGPNSMILALMASGFNGQSFTFNGYLPIEKAARTAEIKRLEKAALTKRQTQLFMETPYRNNSLLVSLLQDCHPDTLLCIAAHITAKNEFIRTKRVADWRKSPPDLHKIPTIFLIGTVRNDN